MIESWGRLLGREGKEGPFEMTLFSGAVTVSLWVWGLLHNYIYTDIQEGFGLQCTKNDFYITYIIIIGAIDRSHANFFNL